MTRDVTEEYQTYGISIGQAGKKNLQGSRLPRISKSSESNSGYLSNTGVAGKEGNDSKDG